MGDVIDISRSISTVNINSRIGINIRDSRSSNYENEYGISTGLLQEPITKAETAFETNKTLFVWSISSI